MPRYVHFSYIKMYFGFLKDSVSVPFHLVIKCHDQEQVIRGRVDLDQQFQKDLNTSRGGGGVGIVVRAGS